jgi:serine/threonine-protein kinase
VLAQLDEYAGWVAKEARDTRLSSALARNDDAALQALCGDIHARHGGAASHISWWFVVDAEGSLRAIFPPPRFGKTYYINFAFRDYFRGGMRQDPTADRPAYVSRAYLSTDDIYKLSIASPIHGDGGVAGVLVASIPTDRHLGALKLSDDRRIAALTVRRDREMAGDPLPSDHILLVHGGVEQGEDVVVESDALRRLTALRDAAGAPGPDQLHLPPPEWVEHETDYRDPMERRDPRGARGPWLAGVAAVGRTELAVIIQTPVKDATAIDDWIQGPLVAWMLGGAALLCASLLAALRTGTVNTV